MRLGDRKRRRAKNLRNKARHLLPLILEDFNYKCYWCGEPIALRRNIDDNTIIEEKHGIISYYEDGIPCTIKLASVDHVNPICRWLQ